MTELRPYTESELVELIRASDERAPDSLHLRVDALVASRGRRRLAPLSRLIGAVAAVAAAIVLVLVLTGGASPSPSLREVSALTLRPATRSAPPERNRAQLAATVDGVPFPYWEERFGWRSNGARGDKLDGRMVTTVFYADNAGRRIGYAILAGTPPPRIVGGVIAWRNGVPYRLLTEDGSSVVTWLRNSHLCVVSGRGVSSATLLRLASWSEHGAVAS